MILIFLLHDLHAFCTFLMQHLFKANCFLQEKTFLVGKQDTIHIRHLKKQRIFVERIVAAQAYTMKDVMARTTLVYAQRTLCEQAHRHVPT